ncbi:MAG: M42 family peptidase, partial [Alphaproteobacteria bacterium]|nr:M42 family peptidase [Alphaproteobacteria bacterium]
MKAESKKFLKKLLASVSPSGYEEEAARVWLAEAETISKNIRHDVHGNAHMVVNKGGYPRVILTGHYDEIGFIVSHIDDKGFISIQPIGGWDPQISQGQRVTIVGKAGKIPGVIGKAPVHWSRGDGDKSITKISQQWVDIGTASKAETEKLVAVGDPLVLAQEFVELQGGRFACRGLDDKLGAFIVLEAGRILAERSIAPEVHIVATCQEEVGLRGAKTAAFGIDAQIGIATDVTFATDHPRVGDNLQKYGDIKIGGGAAVTRGPNVHPRLFDKMREIG